MVAKVQNVDLAPKVAAYYSNRAAALVMVGSHKEAIEDCKKALTVDPKFIKVENVNDGMESKKSYSWYSATGTHKSW